MYHLICENLTGSQIFFPQSYDFLLKCQNFTRELKNITTKIQKKISYLCKTGRKVSNKLNEIFESFDDFGDGEIVENAFAILNRFKENIENEFDYENTF